VQKMLVVRLLRLLYLFIFLYDVFMKMVRPTVRNHDGKLEFKRAKKRLFGKGLALKGLKGVYNLRNLIGE